LKLINWKLKFKLNWDSNFKKFDRNTQKKILKKFEQLKQPLASRGLHSSKYVVEEVGQFRIVFIQDYELKIHFIHFVGNHKQYEKWYKNQ